MRVHKLIDGLFLSLLVVGAGFGSAEVEAANTKRFNSGKASRELQATGDSEAVKAYKEEVKQKIKQAWLPPEGHETDIVVIVFAIDKNGVVNNMRVRKSSGVAAVDDVATEAVRRAAPFGTPPIECGGSVGTFYVFGNQ